MHQSPGPTRARRFARRRGFTLLEIMVSVAVLSITSVGGFAAFLSLNRYAANLRNLSTARALCQERVEQALALAFRPTASIVPIAPNADAATKAATPMVAILGATTNYNTTSGAFTGGSNFQSSTETIPVYTQSDGTSARNSANVTFTRTTTVSPTTLNYAAKGTSLNLVLFTVNVSYVFHGTTYATSMTTLRGPD